MSTCEICGREIKNYGVYLGGIRCPNYCKERDTMTTRFSGKIVSEEDARSVLRTCKKIAGRYYKQAIRDAWATGKYKELSYLECELQQIRNAYGPKWLKETVV